MFATKSLYCFRALPSSLRICCQNRSFASGKEKPLVTVDYFQSAANKNKESYLEMVNMFKEQRKWRAGHVEFIYAALKSMNEFGVDKDLDVYKALIDVFPKGKMVAQNLIQAEFMHYPRHQQCAIDLLEQMEENAVLPDWEVESQLLNTFGSRSFAIRRYWRMMYWLPRWKNASPWPLPRPVPSDNLQLATLAIERITSVDVNSEISVLKTTDVKESVDDTWIVSGQSDEQKDLIQILPKSAYPLYVESALAPIWIRDKPISYFVLRAEPSQEILDQIRREPDDGDDLTNLSSKVGLWTAGDDLSTLMTRSIHVQEDGVYLAVCATGTSSADSLLSWVRLLTKSCPTLSSIPIVFRAVKQEMGDDEEVKTVGPGTEALPPS